MYSEENLSHAFKVNHEIIKIFFHNIKTDLSKCLLVFLPDLRVSRPLINPGYPENTTAVVGGQAKLVCKIHRPASTKVQWLKTEVSESVTPTLRALTVRTTANNKCVLSSSYWMLEEYHSSPA